MVVSEIKSIELCREKPFRHEIVFKDKNGYPLDRFYVKEDVEWEQFNKITQTWMNHPEFAGEGKPNE